MDTRLLPKVAALAASLTLTGCAGINRQFDHWALQQKAQMVLSQPLDRGVVSPLPFRSAEQLEELARPREIPAVAVAPLDRHRMSDAALVQEVLTFPSAISLRMSESNLARAYVYRQGELGARPVLLWVPGQHVGDRDFFSLHSYFERALERGFDVVMFVPPYHLERSPPAFASGDAFLATDFPDHLNAFAQELSDVRALASWLRARGVTQIGAFGSSMGGTIVLRLVSWEPLFEFATLMQPVVDWNALMRRPEMVKVRERLVQQGFSDEDIERAYAAVDARTARPKINPARISVMYGRYDLIAPEDQTLELVGLWGIQRVEAYDRGHSFISIGSRPYHDLGESLDDDAAALRWQRHIRAKLQKLADGR